MGLSVGIAYGVIMCSMLSSVQRAQTLGGTIMKASPILAAAALVTGLSIAPAMAQKPETVHVKGKIEKAEPNAIVVKTKDGDATVHLAANAKVLTIGKGTLADIKKGSYVGVGATPQADGSQKAIRVMIFAPSQRGVGEGFRPWNKPGTTMTNATVDTQVTGVNGQVLTVKYKTGEKKIVVGPDATILLRTDGTHADLKPGATVDIRTAKKMPDGTLEAARVDVGRDGFTP
jgi:hypothetical protein